MIYWDIGDFIASTSRVHREYIACTACVRIRTDRRELAINPPVLDLHTPTKPCGDCREDMANASRMRGDLGEFIASTSRVYGDLVADFWVGEWVAEVLNLFKTSADCRRLWRLYANVWRM